MWWLCSSRVLAGRRGERIGAFMRAAIYRPPSGLHSSVTADRFCTRAEPPRSAAMPGREPAGAVRTQPRHHGRLVGGDFGGREDVAPAAVGPLVEEGFPAAVPGGAVHRRNLVG